jgi:hypothetical protein
MNSFPSDTAISVAKWSKSSCHEINDDSDSSGSGSVELSETEGTSETSLSVPELSWIKPTYCNSYHNYGKYAGSNNPRLIQVQSNLPFVTQVVYL